MPVDRKTARKRVRRIETSTLRNKMKRSAMRTHVKRVMTAVQAGDKETATVELVFAQKKIDKAAKMRVIHPNNASRKKSQLARKVAEM